MVCHQSHQFFIFLYYFYEELTVSICLSSKYTTGTQRTVPRVQRSSRVGTIIPAYQTADVEGIQTTIKRNKKPSLASPKASPISCIGVFQGDK